MVRHAGATTDREADAAGAGAVSQLADFAISSTAWSYRSRVCLNTLESRR
jgi:hypothetical protein